MLRLWLQHFTFSVPLVLYCVITITHLFYLLFLHVLFRWLLFNAKTKTFKLWEICNVKPVFTPLREISPYLYVLLSHSYNVFVIRFVITTSKNTCNYNYNLRFLAQNNCNIIENFEGVIVIAIIMELIWCNWSNSGLRNLFVPKCPRINHAFASTSNTNVNKHNLLLELNKIFRLRLH